MSRPRRVTTQLTGKTTPGIHGSDGGDGEVSELVTNPCNPGSDQVTPAFILPDGTEFNRAPKDMRGWEIVATYRLAWHLAHFLPSAPLARPLANWLCTAQHELEQRGEWRPEALPPQSI